LIEKKNVTQNKKEAEAGGLKTKKQHK